MKVARRLLWITTVLSLIGTALPYFGLLNSPSFIGPFPQPLAVTLICNVFLTLCVLAMYPLYFKPLGNALKHKPIVSKN